MLMILFGFTLQTVLWDVIQHPPPTVPINRSSGPDALAQRKASSKRGQRMAASAIS